MEGRTLSIDETLQRHRTRTHGASAAMLTVRIPREQKLIAELFATKGVTFNAPIHSNTTTAPSEARA